MYIIYYEKYIFVSQNEEASFRQFICGFVAIWEPKLNLKWVNTDICLPSTIDPEAGPSLSRLPDELLPAIAKFLYIAKDNAEKVINNYISRIFITYYVKILLLNYFSVLE